MGSVAFALQYRNDITQFRNAIFKSDWLQYYVEPPLKTRVYMAVDLAISEKGDYFAIVVIGIGEKGNIYVLDTYYNHHSFYTQLKRIKAYADKWTPIKIAVESNAYQAAVPQELKRNTEAFGLLPIFPVQTTTDKITRARKMSALFESGRIHIKRKTQIELVDEILHFPRTNVADDVLDALMLAIEIANVRGSFDWGKVASLNRVLSYARRVI
jgi:predicted phage terminase large subunit-like protein